MPVRHQFMKRSSDIYIAGCSISNIYTGMKYDSRGMSKPRRSI